MSVIEEEGGRLNAFAKEPKIEVINSNSSNSYRFQLIIVAGALVLIGIIAFIISIN